MTDLDTPLVIDAEFVRNYVSRYCYLDLIQALPALVRMALLGAYIAHHSDGANAGDLARDLATTHPRHFTCRD